jgi:hypothetical protein
MPRRTIPALRVAGLVVGTVLVALLVHRLGIHAIGSALSRVGPSFIWLVAAYSAGTVVGAIPWGMLIPSAMRPSWVAVVVSRFAASGVNVLLPFFGIGETGRLLWMPKPAWPYGTAAIVAERLLFIAAGAPLIVAGVYALRPLPGVPPWVVVGGTLLALAIISAALAIGGLAAHGQLARRTSQLLHRLGLRRVPPANAENGEAAVAAPLWDTALRDLLTGRKLPLLAALILQLFARLFFALEIYAGLRVLGLPAGWRETVVMAAVPIALSVLGTFVPGQIGIQEACQSLVAGALGIPPAAGLALVLLQRARQLLFIPLSAVLIAFPLGRRSERTS